MRVDHTIGESAQAAAADLGCERVPGFWVLLYELYGPKGFNQKGIPKACCLFGVPSDGIVQLGLRWLQQADAHALVFFTRYLAITSDKATALISPRR